MNSPTVQGDEVSASASVPMFIQPAPPRRDQLDPSATTLHPESPNPSPSPSAPDYSGEPAADAIADVLTEQPSTPASTRPARALVTAEQVKAARAMVEAMLMGATGLMNHRTRVHPADDRWLMTRDQREQIASPLARILARRSPIPTGGENASDLADGIEAVVALMGYTIEQMITPRMDAPAQAEQHPADAEVMQPTGATLSPLDPDYRVH